MTAHRLVTLAAPRDEARLQHLLERCNDYYELHEGCATPEDAGAYELKAVPPAWTPDAQTVLALEDAGGTLYAAAQFLRDYPKPGTWWIGMLVVDPELRGRGLGATLLGHVAEATVAGGASTIALGVSVNNPRGLKFWEAAGFRPAGGEPRSVRARSGYVDTVRILERPV